MPLKDNQNQYGTVSRVLHWGIAILLLWQFLSAASHFFFDDTAIEAFFWPTHKPMGFLLFVLIFIRVIWALINVKNRPPSINWFARLGHITLYLLMLAIPALGLLRQYGSGRSFEPFGIPLFSGFESGKIEWTLDLGGLLHGELGWLLFVLTIGHIIMSFWHKKSKTTENVMPRMWGRQSKE
ncbi:cytochrome b [Kangiella koreensis]|uniref:Cytochrome B561 n=1 Tax=Kangiella koreensis (strain DSM 16069 / JCM 12317 / KCTC 12182 / SW-125) TaxID=523791 RepID=C7R6K8_KANKD|nr:cytochrome b/b6 domain-containing protein [Kangiella koreensis]ACV25524.1 cytochrome B561 [Kangiella koreensis DSM 16069]